jgi:hypothetical protein
VGCANSAGPRTSEPPRLAGRSHYAPHRLERYHLLIVDEVGYLPLERQAANLLFALVSRRYERGSIVVTSTRSFEQSGEILGDAMVAAALIDRLVHHATMITLNGKSYRLRERGAGVAPARASEWCTFRRPILAHFSVPLDKRRNAPERMPSSMLRRAPLLRSHPRRLERSPNLVQRLQDAVGPSTWHEK